MKRVYNYDEVVRDNYYLVSGYGIPSLIKNHLPNSIFDVASLREAYDYLVVILDAEELSVEERRQEVLDVTKHYARELRGVKVKVIVQNRCIETWLLGNREMVSASPKRHRLRKYIEFYDVSYNNPENMPNYNTDYKDPHSPSFSTIARFHTDYLQEVFREQDLAYTKRNPKIATKEDFLNALIRTVNSDPTDLITFQEFLDFCETVKKN